MAELVTRYDLDVIRRELETKIDMVRHELETKVYALRRDLERKIDTLSLRLTVRMGAMLAAGVAALAARKRKAERSQPSLRSSVELINAAPP